MKVNIRHCYTMSNGIDKKMRIAKGKKNRDIKKSKIKNKTIIPRIQREYTPQFSFHSLERISLRMSQPHLERRYIEVNGIRYGRTQFINWIRPNHLRSIIADIRKSFTQYIYSTASDTILTKGELAKYVIARGGEVITILTDERIEKKYMQKHKYTSIAGHSLELFLFPS